MTFDPALRILTVCTGNICRSPMAEVLLQHHLDQAGVPAVVRSAATHWYGYTAADDDAVAVMAERGLDLGAHRPRHLDAQLVAEDGADLVLAMTRGHLRHVSQFGRGTFRRTFTAKELVRRAGLPWPEAPPAPRLEGLLALAGAGRSPSELLGDHELDDVADPYGRPLAQFRRTADELDALMSRIATTIAAWAP